MNAFVWCSYNKLALNGTVPEVLTEDSGLAGHLHLSHNTTVIRNVPLQPNSDNLLKVPSSKLIGSSMSSSILSSSLKLARQKLLEENSNASVATEKKDDSSSPSDKDAVASTTNIIVTEATMVAETKQKDKIGDTEKCLPVVHHVDRFRLITFKVLIQEQVTTVSMGTLHTAFVTGRYALSCRLSLTMTHLFSPRKMHYYRL